MVCAGVMNYGVVCWCCDTELWVQWYDVCVDETIQLGGGGGGGVQW